MKLIKTYELFFVNKTKKTKIKEHEFTIPFDTKSIKIMNGVPGVEKNQAILYAYKFKIDRSTSKKKLKLGIQIALVEIENDELDAIFQF